MVFVTGLCAALAEKTKTDLGTEPKEAIVSLLDSIDLGYRARLRVVNEIASDADPIIEKLEHIDEAINNLVSSIDDLPYHVRDNMRWAWESLPVNQSQEGALLRQTLDERHTRSELLELKKKLSVSVKNGKSVASRYRQKNWTNKKLIALMWAVDHAARYNLENLLDCEPPKSIKNGDPWADFIKGMARTFDIECKNLHRNWNYMCELKKLFSRTNRI